MRVVPQLQVQALVVDCAVYADVDDGGHRDVSSKPPGRRPATQFYVRVEQARSSAKKLPPEEQKTTLQKRRAAAVRSTHIRPGFPPEFDKNNAALKIRFVFGAPELGTAPFRMWPNTGSVESCLGEAAVQIDSGNKAYAQKRENPSFPPKSSGFPRSASLRYAL